MKSMCGGIDVKEADLVVLLVQDKEESIQKLNEFGEVKQPYCR